MHGKMQFCFEKLWQIQELLLKCNVPKNIQIMIINKSNNFWQKKKLVRVKVICWNFI